MSGAGEGEASDDHRESFEDAKYKIQTSSSGAKNLSATVKNCENFLQKLLPVPC